jgi:photosystem II stability/assembly factor-like uncharacterized protein
MRSAWAASTCPVSLERSRWARSAPENADLSVRHARGCRVRRGATTLRAVCTRTIRAILLCAAPGLASSLIMETGCAPPGTQSMSTAKPRLAYDAAFAGSEAAWIVTESGDLLRTTNGGANWDRIPGDSVAGFRRVSFVDTQMGWMLSAAGKVWRTSDGGLSWTVLGGLDTARDFLPGLVQQMCFLDDVHGWAMSPFNVWVTSDSGVTWNRHSLPGSVDEVLATARWGSFLSPRQCWLGAERGAIFQTSDGGTTWRGRRVARTDQDMRAMFFTGPTDGWAAEWPRGPIYRSTDGGETWSRREGPVANLGVASMSFVGANEGWAAGHYEPFGLAAPYKSIALLLHTANAGETWETSRLSEDDSVYDRVDFGDLRHGWLLSDGGTRLEDRPTPLDRLYYTRDGGTTWDVALDYNRLQALVSSHDGSTPLRPR